MNRNYYGKEHEDFFQKHAQKAYSASLKGSSIRNKLAHLLPSTNSIFTIFSGEIHITVRKAKLCNTPYILYFFLTHTPFRTIENAN